MITVDKEFESMIPPLSSEEFAQLEENCVKDGIRDPLVVWELPDGDILVDGHNRWKISAKHAGIRFNVVKMHFENRDAAKEWILKNQLGRRNLPSYVRAQLALRLKPIIAEKAKEQQGQRTDICQKSDKSPIDTKKELATIAGVSHDTIHKVEVVEKHGTPEIKAKARSGEISTNEAYRQTTNIMRPIKKDDIVKQAEEEHADFIQKKTEAVVSLRDAAVDAENKRILALELSKRTSKAFNAIQNITLFNDDLKGIISALTAEEKHDVKKTIDTCISCLSILREMIGG